MSSTDIQAILNYQSIKIFSLTKSNGGRTPRSRAVGYCDKINALDKRGKYDDAIKAEDEAIRLDPNHASTWLNKGYALGIQGKLDDAIKAWDEAIRLDPKYALAWYNKGIALNKLGLTTEANAAYA